MKKKLVLLMLSWTLTIFTMTGCGNENTPTNGTEPLPGAENVTSAENHSSEDVTPSESATPEPTAEPTPEPTAEPTPEPTAEPTPEPEVAVTDEWAVDMYNAVLKDDYATVMELLADSSNVKEHCEGHEDSEWPVFEGETVYSMLMSDGDRLRFLVFESEDGEWLSLSAYVTYHEYSVGLGDHCITMYPDGTYAYIKDGTDVVSTSPGMASFTLNEFGWW